MKISASGTTSISTRRCLAAALIGLSGLTIVSGPSLADHARQEPTFNRITLNHVTLNRLAFNRLAFNRLALNRLALNGLQLNRLALNGLQSRGHEVGVTRVGTIAAVDGRLVIQD